MELKKFENTSALDNTLSAEVSERLSNAIEKHGKASLILSGGRTPMGFFHQLSQQILEWDKVTVTLADERWVDNDHQDSNEKLVRENLLINEAHCAQFLSLKNAADTAVDGEPELEAELSKQGQFTVVILGMGDDGHTASLFPETPALSETERWVTGNYVPKFDEHRITFTYPLINAARRVCFLVNGKAKRPIYEAIFAGDGNHFPAAHIAPASGQQTWIIGN